MPKDFFKLDGTFSKLEFTFDQAIHHSQVYSLYIIMGPPDMVIREMSEFFLNILDLGEWKNVRKILKIPEFKLRVTVYCAIKGSLELFITISFRYKVLVDSWNLQLYQWQVLWYGILQQNCLNMTHVTWLITACKWKRYTCHNYQ